VDEANQQAVSEPLQSQIPDVPWHAIYEKVNGVRVTVAKQLPDPAAYAEALEQNARALIVATVSRQSSIHVTEDVVVDRDQMVVGVDNLYLSDGSVLPTQGSANPAPTIMAPAARLADHLRGSGRPAP
jgi:choline dehydrogenase-like flavoprotein